MRKLPYFDPEWSIAKDAGSLEDQLSVIAERYVGANPPTTFRIRAVSTEQFMQSADGSWELDLVPRLKGGTDGYSIVGGVLMSGLDKLVTIGISCFSPAELYLNDGLIFRSSFTDEVNLNPWHFVDVQLKQGRNTIAVICRRTAAGFGCRLSLPQTTVLSPLKEREGQAGWIWSDLLEEKPLWRNGASGGLYWDSEETGRIHWNPDTDNKTGEAALPASTPQQRLFPEGGGYSLAWCRLKAEGETEDTPSLIIESSGYNRIYLGRELLLACEKGTFEISVPSCADSDLRVISRCIGSDFGALVHAKGCELLPPGKMNGTDESWVYAGCFESEEEAERDGLLNLLAMPGGKRWLLDKKNTCLRTFFEGSYGDKHWVSQGGSAFGRWDYPLGVTLLGLLKTADALGKEEIRRYAERHIKMCVSMYESAVCDKALYGAPAFDQNLVRLECLDDCGSMGAAMLESHKLSPDEKYLETAGRIREFIVHRLSKLADGTFYRPASGSHGTATIWADDLYMSTPFLRCLYDITGDREALELAAGQFLKFASYLFMPEYGVFSHVYDLTRQCATGIAWGRGNGWVLFSLAYFLDGLTEKPENYDDLMRLFLTLSSSYRKLQGEKGLWHQVLTDPSSYEEASCTAMFTFAFCKGIQNGWYGKEAPLYREAAERGFQGLTQYCIDRNGSVYGVCKGSGFSFTKEYYRDELFWVTNDNHGTGIVLLAGTELLRLNHARQEKSE